MPPQLRKRPAVPPKPIMTAAQELRRYASSLHRGCRCVSTLEDITSLLSSISDYARLSQFFAPCTKSDSQPCHLLDQFSVWSRFLLASDMELLETAPETLSLLCLPYRHSSGRPENYGPQLVNFHQLRSLSMYLGDDLVGGDAATCIALFLASTKTLREARFVFTTTEESTHTLLKGISRNRSISELGIGRWSFGAAEMDLVHQIIKANTVLRSLNICPRDCKKSPLLELLPKYLLDNDHLLRVHMGPVLANYPVTQQLQEVTRRNLSRLYRAVLFVTGSRGRRYADAFDRVCASPTLIKEVMKYASESEEVATQRVRSHKIYLDQHFWVEVGVVRGAMMCENSDGGVQLDQIGLDNWLCIRQFLKVADIREPPAQAAATYRPRKRRYHSR
ncbi:uncharacterized protein ISCGN_016770 [Ixodes scapularis]